MTSLPQIVTSQVIGIPGPPGLGVDSATLTTIQGNISTLQGEMTTALVDIAGAEGDIDDLEVNIALLNARWVSVPIDGGGSTIGTGVRARVLSPADGIIAGWRMMADQVGSVVLNLWEREHPNVPSVAQQITGGSEKPTLSAAQAAEDLSLNGGAGWAIHDGYHLWVNVESATTVTYVTLGLLIAWGVS
ncbi:MAG: hypothetical protein AB7V46_15235 [Thermomicrobiales bacterium]